MKKGILLFIVGLLFISAGCDDENLPEPSKTENIAGTYFRTITVSDGQERSFIVYIPPTAAGHQEVPVLIVIHGTNQNGQIFYDNPNLWNPKADQEGFIVVYPTALTYCHFDNGVQRTTTKWAAGDLGQTDVSLGALPLCTGEILRDDMLFFDELIQTIKKDYLVNEQRFYLTGFSNGAQMAARLAAQRSEVFAAVTVHAGNLSSFIPAVLSSRPMSLMVTVGAADPLFLQSIGANSPVAVDANALSNAGVAQLLEPFLKISGLDFQHTYSSTQYFGKDIGTFTFQTSNVGLDNYVRFVLIEDLEHSYTGILINPFWDFLKNKSLP